MLIHLDSETGIRLTGAGEGFAFDPAEGVTLSPFHLLAASLATCTWSVLHTWAEHAGLETEGLEIAVAWEYGGEPYRVTQMAMDLDWPGLPEARHEAARRVAKQCTVEQTLEHPTPVRTRVTAPS